MTTEEHLELILTFCRSRLALPIGSLNSSASRAGWRATIQSIGRFRQIADMAKAHPVFENYATWAEQGLENILAAYPLELLTETTA